MKNIIIFILFITYTISAFLIDNKYIILAFAVLNIILMLLLRINIKKAFKNLEKISLVIFLVGIINYFVVDFNYAVFIVVRLILVCNMTYIFSKILPPVKLAITIEKMIYPLKIFKVNTKDIGLIISIALAFFPILTEEINQTIFALKAKGVKLKMQNIKVLLNSAFSSIIKRIEDIEFALKAKRV